MASSDGRARVKPSIGLGGLTSGANKPPISMAPPGVACSNRRPEAWTRLRLLPRHHTSSQGMGMWCNDRGERATAGGPARLQLDLPEAPASGDKSAEEIKDSRGMMVCWSPSVAHALPNDRRTI